MTLTTQKLRFRICQVTAAAAAMLMFGCHRTSADPVLTQLRNLLADGTIVRMKVVHIPYSVTSPAAIQPSQMRENGLDLSRLTVPGPFDSLSRALRKSTATPVHRPPDVIEGESKVVVEGQTCYPLDVRWSCILYDKNNREVGSIFLGRRFWFGVGKIGIINDKLLKLNGVLISWFEDNFLHLFDETMAAPDPPGRSSGGSPSQPPLKYNRSVVDRQVWRNQSCP